DRQLTMAAVNERRQANARWPPQVANRVERRANRPPGEQHVINQNQFRSIKVKGNLGSLEHGPPFALPHVISIERDVDGPDFDVTGEQVFHRAGQPFGEGPPPASNSHQIKRSASPRGLCELASHLRDQSFDLLSVAKPLFARFHRRAPAWTL